MSSSTTSSPPPDAHLKAIQAEQKCAQFVAISAVLDLCAFGLFLMDWLAVLRIVWKLVLAVNLYRAGVLWSNYAAKMRQQNSNHPEKARYQQGQTLLQILQTMTRVWRVTAITVALSACGHVYIGWHGEIGQLGGGLFAVVVVIFAMVYFQSTLETNDFTHVDASGDPTALVPTLQKQGAIVCRTMAMAAVAFFLQVGLTPLMALYNLKRHSWHDIFILILSIPVPMTVANSLITFRSKYIEAFRMVSDDLKHKKKTDSDKKTAEEFWQSESQQELGEAAEDFYGELTRIITIDIAAKSLFFLVSISGGFS